MNTTSDSPVVSSAHLTRPREGRMLGGVAAGLANYLGVDPIVVRAAFVVLAFLGGVGIFLYALGWLMIPPSPASRPDGERLPSRLLGRARGRPAWLGVILLAVGAALVVNRLGLWHPAVFWGVTLVVVGIVLFREDRAWSTGPRSPAIPPTKTDSPATEPEATQELASVLPGTPVARLGRTGRWPFGPRQAAPSSPPRVRREPSPLGWLALGAVLLAVGGTAVLDQANAVHLELAQYLALALTIVGAALLVGAWRGRARWLILPGLLLVPLVVVASFIDVPITGGFGNRYVNPRDTGELQLAYALTAGDLIIDLRSVRFGAGEVGVAATVAAGRISVLLPEHVSVSVRAHAGAGRVSVFGRAENGIRVDVTRSSPASGSIGNLILDLKTGVGEVIVYRALGEGLVSG